MRVKFNQIVSFVVLFIFAFGVVPVKSLAQGMPPLPELAQEEGSPIRVTYYDENGTVSEELIDKALVPQESTSCTLSGPILQSPLNGVTTNTLIPYLQWSGTGAGMYRIQISYNSDFSNLALDVTPGWGQSYPTHTHSLWENLAANTLYYWRITSVCWDNSEGGTSAISTFRTPNFMGPFIGAPALLSPSDGEILSSSKVTFTWGDVSGATGWQIRFYSSLSDAYENKLWGGSLYDTWANSIELGFDLGYTQYWRVMVKNEYAWGPPSAIRTLIMGKNKPILMIPGWGGSVGKYVSTEDENLSYLGKFLSSHGYVEGINMFYASGTSPNLNQAANAKIIRFAICTAHARYKQKFGDIPVFNIIGHSYGGLRARAYLESSMYKNQERCPIETGTTDIIRVENLITLGTPHGGEYGDHPLAFFLGLMSAGNTIVGNNNWPAMYELLPSVRDSQNRQSGGRPDGVIYHLVAGNAISQEDTLSVVLRFLFNSSVTTRYIPNDLAVTQYRSFSLQEYGDLYGPLSLIGTIDSHGLCDQDGVGFVLGSICASFGLDDLQSYMHNSSTLETEVLPILNASNQGLPVPMQAANLTAASTDEMNSVLADVNAMSTPVEHAGMPIREIASGSLSGSEIVNGTFVVEAAGASQIHLGWLDEKISLSLIDPNGHTVVDGDAGMIYSSFTMGMGWTTIYHFENLIPGTWSYQIKGEALTQEIPYRFFQIPSSSIRLSSALPEWLANGSDVSLTATVWADETTRISGGSVTAAINKPNGSSEVVTLYDDGVHGDQAVADGIFGGIYPNVTLGGIYGVAFTAFGSYQGQNYTRNASATFSIAPATASFTASYSDQGVNESGDSRFEWLEIRVPIIVNTAGTYTLSGELYAGSEFMGALRVSGDWTPGSQGIGLRMDSQTIYQLRMNGSYTFRNVMLTDESGITTLIQVDDPNYLTADYLYTDFYSPEQVFLPLITRDIGGVNSSLVPTMNVQ